MIRFSSSAVSSYQVVRPRIRFSILFPPKCDYSELVEPTEKVGLNETKQSRNADACPSWHLPRRESQKVEFSYPPLSFMYCHNGILRVGCCRPYSAHRATQQRTAPAPPRVISSALEKSLEDYGEQSEDERFSRGKFLRSFAIDCDCFWLPWRPYVAVPR